MFESPLVHHRRSAARIVIARDGTRFRLFGAAVAMVVCLVACHGGGTREPDDRDLHRVLAELRSPIVCDDPRPLVREWCVAAGGWESAMRDVVPARNLIGIRARFGTESHVPEALEQGVSLAAAVVAMGPGDACPCGAALGPLQPDDESQVEELRSVLPDLEGVLSGGRSEITLPPQLAGFLAIQRKAVHPLSTEARGWQFSGRNRVTLRHVGTLWVAVEWGSKHDIFVSLLTDRVRQSEDLREPESAAAR